MAGKKSVGLRLGERYNPLNRELVKAFRKKTGNKTQFELFKTIVWETCALYADSIANYPEGVELPEGMGYVVVTKYKPRDSACDVVNSVRYRKFVPHLNLHSFGWMYKIRWYRVGTRIRNDSVYWLSSARSLRQLVSQSIKGGTKFFRWNREDFYSSTKLERTYKKFFGGKNFSA